MIYLAGDIFTEASRDYNAKLAERIREAVPGEALYLPQENTEINDKTKFADSLAIARGDNGRLDKSDLLVVVLDNLESGQGRCAEVGYACAKGIPIIGLWTDTRQEGTDNVDKINILRSSVAENQFAYINLYVIGCIKQNGYVVDNIDDLIDAVRLYIKPQKQSLYEKVEQWGKDKGITDPKAQMTKVLEECTELNSAVFKDDEPEIIDALGDVQVTLIILQNTLGEEPKEFYYGNAFYLFTKEEQFLTTLFNEASAINEQIQHDRNDKELVNDIWRLYALTREFAEFLGYTPDDCLQTAYDVISKRTGKSVNGVFVKDE